MKREKKHEPGHHDEPVLLDAQPLDHLFRDLMGFERGREEPEKDRVGQGGGGEEGALDERGQEEGGVDLSAVVLRVELEAKSFLEPKTRSS